MSIWESFVEFLEDLLRRFGLFKMIIAFSGFASTLIGLALGFHLSSELKVGLAGVFVIVVLLLTSLALIIDRHRLRSAMAEGNGVLNRYGDEIVSRQTSETFEIKEWRDEQFIDKNGDTTINRWFTLVAGNQPLQTFWHLMVMSAEQADYRYQKKVTIQAKTFDPESRQPGVSYLLSRRWEGNAVRLFVHLDRPYQAGEEVHVVLQVFWPEYTKELLENRAGDTAEWTFRRKVGKLHVTLSFAKDLRIKQNFALKALPNSPAPSQSLGPDGRRNITFEADNPRRDTRFGFLIQRTDVVA